MKVFIYSLSDPRSDEVRYVGKAVDPEKRLYGHTLVFRSNTHKTAWIKSLRKLGLKPKMEILEALDDCSDAEWQESERFWIRYLRFLGCRLTNAVDGGYGGRKASEHTRQKMSASMRAFYAANPSQREARSKEGFERKHSPESIAKMRAVQSCRSEETISKMRAAAKKRGVSPEHIARFVESGRKNLTDPAFQAKRKAAAYAALMRRWHPNENPISK